MALAGHSYGGATVTALCSQEPAFKCTIALDPWWSVFCRFLLHVFAVCMPTHRPSPICMKSSRNVQQLYMYTMHVAEMYTSACCQSFTPGHHCIMLDFSFEWRRMCSLLFLLILKTCPALQLARQLAVQIQEQEAVHCAQTLDCVCCTHGLMRPAPLCHSSTVFSRPAVMCRCPQPHAARGTRNFCVALRIQ